MAIQQFYTPRKKLLYPPKKKNSGYAPVIDAKQSASDTDNAISFKAVI